MDVIKLTTPWDHNYKHQIPIPLKSKYIFEINNDCDEADYWFVWGAVREKEVVSVAHENTFFIVEEAFKERQYKQSFLNQFKHVITCRDDIKHLGLIKHHDLGIWYFNKCYEELMALENIEKSKKISVVSSDLTWLEGHKKRYAFVNKLIGHFKDRIDVYGKGFNYIEDKFDALYPYRYSVAIENNSLKNYFTEKIFECYLTYTVPIYYGCVNISDYFSSESFAHIDINDYKGSINKIERLIDDDALYQQYTKTILKEREKVFNQYHIFASLDKIIQNNKSNLQNKKKTIVLYPEFGSSYLAKIKQIVKNISG